MRPLRALAIAATLAAAAEAQTYQADFFSNSDSSWSRFGTDLGADGNALAIGGDGFVEIWDRSGSDVTFRQELVSPNPLAGNGFGQSLDAAAGLLVVGATNEDVSGSDSAGRAYLYEDQGGTYQLIAELTSSTDIAQFGWAVDLSSNGETLLVSAPGEGKVYFYEQVGGVWTPVFEATFASGGGGRGKSVHVEGDRAFIGDPYADRVRYYERSGGSWAFVESIADGISGNQQFGWSLDVSGRWLVVGMPNYEPAGASLYQNSGGARIYEQVGGSWVLSATVTVDDWTLEPSTYGGRSVAVEGDRVLVGAYGHDTVARSAGSVTAVEYDGANWIDAGQILPPAGTPIYHYFGSIVHYEEGTVLIAATGNAGPTLSYNGQAYLYRADTEVGSSYCGPAVPNSTGDGATISGFGSPAVSDGALTLQAAGLPRQVFGFFLASQTQGLVAMPGGSQGTLCLGGQIGRVLDSIQNSGLGGALSFELDLSAIPQPNGPASASAGETWSFQAWYRDSNPAVTSNYTDGLEVTFQ